MSLKLHPSYISDIQSMGIGGDSLSDLWIKSSVPMYSDSECLLSVDNPCSMEVINIADIRFKERPTITIMDNNGNELYVDEAMAIDETFGISTKATDDIYLPKTGGVVTGGITMLGSPVGFTFPNGQWNNIGDDTRFGDINVANTFGVQSTSNNNVGYVRFGNTTSGATIGTDGTNFTVSAPLSGSSATFSGQVLVSGAISEGGILLSNKYVNQAVQYTNPTWLAGIDATTIKTGTIDLARLPAMPSSNTVVCTTIPAMTSADQLLVAKGTVVIESSTGNTYRYSGTGSVVLNASYIQQSDLTPDWAVITNKPTNVSTWSNAAGYLTNGTGDTRYLKLAGGTVTGGVSFNGGATFNTNVGFNAGALFNGGRLNLYKKGATSADRLSHGFGFGDAYTGVVSFYGFEANLITSGVGAADGPFMYGYRGVALGCSNAGTTNGDLVAALRTDLLDVYVAGNIRENGTFLSAKYAPLVHTHTTAQITGLDATLATFLVKDNGIGTGEFKFSNGTFTDPAPSDTRDAKFGNKGIATAALRIASVNGLLRATNGVVAVTTLSASDIPALDWSKITTGKPTTLAGYGITDAVSYSGNNLFQVMDYLGNTANDWVWFGYSGIHTSSSRYAGFMASKNGEVIASARYNQSGYLNAENSENTTVNVASWNIDRFHVYKNLTVAGTISEGGTLLSAKYALASDSRLSDARTPNNNAALVQGSTANTGAQGKRTIGLGSGANVINSVLDSGFYDSAATTNPNGNWMHFINSAHNNNYAGNQYQFQIGASFSNDKNQSWGPEGYWVRTICGNAQVGAWRKLWHDGNFNPGSYQPLENQRLSTTNEVSFSGLKLGYYSNTTYSGIWHTSVTKGDNNWAFLTNTTNTQTYLNAATSLELQIYDGTNRNTRLQITNTVSTFSTALVVNGAISGSGNLVRNKGSIKAIGAGQANIIGTDGSSDAGWNGMELTRNHDGNGVNRRLTYGYHFQDKGYMTRVEATSSYANDMTWKLLSGVGTRSGDGWTSETVIMTASGSGVGIQVPLSGTSATFSNTLSVGGETVNAAALKRLNSSSNMYGVNRLYRADGTDQYWVEAKWEEGWVGYNSWRLRGQNNQGPDGQTNINTVLVDYAYNAYGAVTADTAIVAKKLLSVSGTTVQSSTWNPLGIANLTTQVWGQACTHASLNADSGDICFWLRNGVYNTSGTELCVVIDGDYYAGGGTNKVWHAGNLSLTNTSFSGNIYTTGSFQAANYVLGSSAYMGMWAIDNAYAWFGLNGTNGNTWATANGLGTNGTNTWLCASGSLRGCAGNNTDALWITGTELYSKNSIYSFGSFVGSVVAPSDSLGSASRLGVLSSNKQNGWCISYGASGDMQLWDSTANNWTLRYRFTQLAMKMPIYAVAGSSGTTIAPPLYDGEVRLYRGATGQGACYLKCRASTEIVRYRTDAGVKVDLDTAATNVPVDIQGTVVMLIWAMNGASDGRWTMLS